MDIALTELEPQFIRHEVRDGSTFHVPVDHISRAQGVRFLCPKCFLENKGPVGTHSVVCWNGSVPPEVRPGPGRWSLEGTSLADLTLGPVPGKTRSVLLLGGCEWHGFVTNGRVT